MSVLTELVTKECQKMVTGAMEKKKQGKDEEGGKCGLVDYEDLKITEK